MARDLAVYPNLGIIIKGRLKYKGRASRRNLVYAFGDRYLYAVPVKRDPPVSTPLVQVARRHLLPRSIVKIRDAGMRSIVISFYRRAGRLIVGASGLEIGLDDPCVAVFPLSADRLCTLFGCQIDRSERLSRRNTLRDDADGRQAQK